MYICGALSQPSCPLATRLAMVALSGQLTARLWFDMLLPVLFQLLLPCQGGAQEAEGLATPSGCL